MNPKRKLLTSVLVRNVFCLEQGYKLQLSQNKVLRKVLGTKKVAVSKGFQTYN